MSFDAIVAALRDKLGDRLLEAKADALDPFVVVTPDALLEAARLLHDVEDIALDDLSNLTAVDYPPDRIQVVYHLWSYTHLHGLVLKVDLDRAKPAVESVSSIWPAAEWHEREAYDLVGVHFEHHRDLRRLLLPEDWDGYPLRKDWVEPAAYHGMPTTRQFSNTLFAELSEQLKRARPLQALVVHDAAPACKQAAEVLARRLTCADIAAALVEVGQADPAQVAACDLLILGAHAEGLLSAAPSAAIGGFIDRLSSLEQTPCAFYVTHRAKPAAAVEDLFERLAAKRARVLAGGAVSSAHPDKDPDDLAAVLVDAVRTGRLPRPQAPEAAPAPSPSDAESNAKAEASAAASDAAAAATDGP